KLDVAPGAVDAATAGSGPSAPRGVTTVSRDLRYLRTAPRRGLITRVLEAAAAGGPLHALPFLLFATVLGRDLYRRRLSSDPAGARSRAALKAAQARLTQAKTAKPSHAAEAAGEALTRYLADKLGQAASGLTAKRAQDLIRIRRPDADLALLDRVKQGQIG